MLPAPSEAHHWPQKGHGYMAGKCGDDRLVPLCRTHHQEYHNHGRLTFSLKYRIDEEHLVRRLNEIWLNISKQNAI